MTTKHEETIFGAPGTGKTTTLMNRINVLVSKGYDMADICFTTFSRSASSEAKDRMVKNFQVDKDFLKYFGTIHSICFKEFSIGRKLIKTKEKEEFFKKVGVDYDSKTDSNPDEMVSNFSSEQTDGNILLAFYDKLRLYSLKDITKINSNNELKNIAINMKFEKYTEVFSSDYNPCETLKKYDTYKKANDVMDFCDMLLDSYNVGWSVPTKILIVDEFQDLSPLQYEIYKQWAIDKEVVIIAGDDDQTIYRFLEANPQFLLMEKIRVANSGGVVTILYKTYRMKENINKHCLNFIENNIPSNKRVVKKLTSVNSGGDIIIDDISFELSNILKYIDSEETFILTRTNYYKSEIRDKIIIPNGIKYNEIRGTSIWNERSISIFNGLLKILDKKPISYEELKHIIQNIDTKTSELKRGLKTNFTEVVIHKDEYLISDLIEIGISQKFLEQENLEKLIALMNISETQSSALLSTDRKIISKPINLHIGTIHSSKGMEASKVIYIKDISKKISKIMNESIDARHDEIRLSYVARSRPKNKLIILKNCFIGADAYSIPDE